MPHIRLRDRPIAFRDPRMPTAAFSFSEKVRPYLALQLLSQRAAKPAWADKGPFARDGCPACRMAAFVFLLLSITSFKILPDVFDAWMAHPLRGRRQRAVGCLKDKRDGRRPNFAERSPP